MGPRIREDKSGDGFPSLSSWGQALRGHDEGMGPRIREDKSGDGFPSLSSWGKALRGHDEGMGPRIREDNGRGGGCGRLKGKGLPVAAGFSEARDDASKAWGGEVSRRDYDALFLKFLQSFPTRFDAKLG